MLLVTYRARLSDRSTQPRTIEIGRLRSGSVADYVAIERAADGEVVSQRELLGYPRWAEHASGLAARCAHLLSPWTAPDRVDTPSIGLPIEAAWIEIGLGSQRDSMRKRLERIQYVRTGFAPRILVARENWPSYDYPAPAYVAADTCALVWLLRLAAWGTCDPIGLPGALDVPVHVEGDGPPFVRLADIPEPARTAFDRWMEGATVPARDSAYVWDWKRFCEGA